MRRENNFSNIIIVGSSHNAQRKRSSCINKPLRPVIDNICNRTLQAHGSENIPFQSISVSIIKMNKYVLCFALFLALISCLSVTEAAPAHEELLDWHTAIQKIIGKSKNVDHNQYTL